MDRFLRTQLLLGDETYERLQNSRVTVIGVGAVGGYATEALARSGIRHLRLIDFDRVTSTNINRQLLALTSTIGRTKVDVARERVLDINPEIQVEAMQMFADDQSMEQILDNSPDLVIDAIDSLNPKVQVLSALKDRNIPVISSMGAALRTDPFMIRTGDISSVTKCPLGKAVRKRLKRVGINSGIFCIYSDEPVKKQKEDVIMFSEDTPLRGRRRRVLGSLPTLTGIFGLIIANCAIELLTRRNKN